MLPAKPPPQPPELGYPCSPSEEEEEEGAKKSKKKVLQGRKGRAETSSEATTSESSSSGSDSGSEEEAKQRKAVRAGMGWDGGLHRDYLYPLLNSPSLPCCSPLAARPAPRRSPCLTWMTVSGVLECANGRGGGAGETEA